MAGFTAPGWNTSHIAEMTTSPTPWDSANARASGVGGYRFTTMGSALRAGSHYVG